MKRIRKALVLLATLGLLLSLSGIVGGVAARSPYKDTGIRADKPDYNNGETLPFDRADLRNANPPLGPAKIGETKTWLGLDDERGVINLKNYTLRGVGNHIEVWVANNLNFPNTTMLNPLTEDPNDYFTYNDCRNDGVRNVITDDQVQYLIGEFDGNMYPIESDWWSVPPARNGSKNLLAKQLGFPKSYYRGEGDNIVTLIDNVRDSNFYDQDNQSNDTYIAGFYYSVFDDYFDRTVMSVDAWDWIHRTTADPPHNPTSSLCTSAPARPYLYEGVFAHEYQHLLHHYTDPDELTWVNEGLSDFTEVITGYVDLSKHVDEKGYEGHTQCYLGWVSVAHPDWNPIPRDCGPENGLTAWEDQGEDEVLADYGNALYFMNYVRSQGLGKSFFTSWQHNQGNGIEGLESALAAAGSSSTFQSLLEDDMISALIDGYLDNGATGAGSRYQNDAAEATVYLSDEAHSSPGAPPNGADYIDIGDGANLTSVSFDGAGAHNFPSGPQWVVDGDGYWTNPDEGGDAADNYGDEKDYSIVYQVSGVDGQALTFDHYYELEDQWDFGTVQYSTDEGATFETLACSGTTSSHDPGAMPSIVANLPGYTGTAGTAGSPVSATCPALPSGVDYIAFRMQSDWATNFDGWHVKNARLNGTLIDATPDDLSDWDNIQHLQPLDLSFGLALVGINGSVETWGDIASADSVTVLRPTVDADQDYTLTSDDLDDLSGFDQVVAMVWGIPGDETSTLYQPYSLMVNGTEMADGG